MRFGTRTLLLAVLIIAFAIQSTRVGVDYLHSKKRGELTRLGTGHAFLIHESEMLLLRDGDAYGAFVPRLQNRGGSGEVVEYEWYYRTDGKGTLDTTDAAVKHGKGVSTRPTTDVNVKFGPFALQWSGADEGWGWVYYRPSGSSDTGVNATSRFCIVRGSDLNDIDAASRRWLYVSDANDDGIRGDQAFEPGRALSAEDLAQPSSQPAPRPPTPR